MVELTVTSYFRYIIKESLVKGGLLSTLFITSSIKADSGIFMCVATNPFGKAERVVHLQVQGKSCHLVLSPTYYKRALWKSV